MSVTRFTGGLGPATSIRHSAEALPEQMPAGHVGPVMLRGTGRLVYWTGRVAIGLRHEPPPRAEAMSSSALWIQELLTSQRAA